jgi:hypothetical protein
MAYPHASLVSRSLGVSLPFRAVYDPAACAARRTRAFTDKDLTHFSEARPNLHVAVHEAVHQAQHVGLTKDGGLGAEGQACAAADEVRAGRTASHLLGPHGAPVVPAERHYVGEGDERLADTGETLTFNTHDAFATAALITQAEGILKARKSGISLSPGAATRVVVAPDGSGTKTLSQVAVKMDIDPSGEKFFGDCQQAAAEVMGGKGMSATDAALIKGSAGQTSVPLQRNPLNTIPLLIYVDQQIKKTPDYASYTEEEKRVFIAKAKSTFDAMTEKEIDALRKTGPSPETAKQWGADQYALPAAGEAYAIFPERPPTRGSNRYDYHFATVVMVTGNDRITFENAGGNRDEKTVDWSFRTYGTKEGQSFYEQWSPKFHRTSTTVVVVGNLPKTPTDIGAMVAQPTAALIALYATAPPESQFYLKRELDQRFVSATIKVVKKDDWVGDDEPYLKFAVGSSTVATPHPHIKEGASGTVAIAASQLLPVSNPLTVQVMEYDLLSRDDKIGTIAWPSPYESLTTTLTSGKVQYVVTLSL